MYEYDKQNKQHSIIVIPIHIKSSNINNDMTIYCS